MPVINRIASYADDMKTWRRFLHTIPELEFDCHKTAAFVVDKLRSFGITDIHEGIATSGVVAIIEGQGPGPTIGLRADMDALPMSETTGLDYQSTVPGMMHACGHDGHTTMLLGAARYLSETRNFKGRVALIFQPAEEEGAGGNVMVEEGILDRFDIGELYALHNAPGTPVGHFVSWDTQVWAAVDTFEITLTGVGGHGAYPQDCVDPIPAAISIAQALGTIVSRNHDGRDDLVLSVTQIHAGTASNIIPETAFLNGTVRSFDKDVQALVQKRIQEIVAGQAASFGVKADLKYLVGYPATINDPDRAAFATEVAREIAGDAGVEENARYHMGAEDFAYFLNKRPGAYLMVGNGPSAEWHHPAFDFADESSAAGASFFARLVERAQPVD